MAQPLPSSSKDSCNSWFGSLLIPRRKDEGYGLTKEILARGLKLGDVKLVIALDCGTNSFEEPKILAGKGIDLVVVDHHQAKEELPEEPIMLNPHLHPDEGEPWRNLCTAGLAFKLIHGLIKELRERDCSNAHSVDLKKILPFVADTQVRIWFLYVWKTAFLPGSA